MPEVHTGLQHTGAGLKQNATKSDATGHTSTQGFYRTGLSTRGMLIPRKYELL